MKYKRRQFVSASALAFAAGATARSTAAEAPQTGFAEVLQRAGIREAAADIGMDADKVFWPLIERANHSYRSYRWSASYAETGGPLIHHVHMSAPNERTAKEPWRERDGAPQRPAELFGTRWYWYDDSDMTPALAT
jgi:hypothetical protein